MEICIIGKGSIGLRHGEIFHSLGFKITFFRSFKSNIKKKIKFKYFETNNFDKIKKKKFDLIIVANPTYLHFKTLIKFNKICKNFLIEKPVVNSHIELKKIIKIIKLKNLNIFTGYMMRFDPRIKNIKERIKNNNTIFSRFIWHSFLPDWHKYENFKKSYAFIKKMGGGVIKTCSHEIDLSTYINGPAKHVFCFERKRKFKGNIEESVIICVRHINNSLSEIDIDFSTKKLKRFFIINTNKLSSIYNFNSKYVNIENAISKKKIKINKCSINDIYLNQNKFIASNLNKNKRYYIKYNFESEKIIFAAIKSLKEKKIININ